MISGWETAPRPEVVEDGGTMAVASLTSMVSTLEEITRATMASSGISMLETIEISRLLR